MEEIWYTPEEKLPELGDKVIYVDKITKETKELVYALDWICKHKHQLDIMFKGYCKVWKYAQYKT